MPKELPHLAKALRHARSVAGLSQNQLAKLAGVSRPTIATIEIGMHQNAQADTIKKLAKALQINVIELLGSEQSADDDALDELLGSELAAALKISGREKQWLRALHRDWPAGKMTFRAFLLLVEALRLSDVEA